MTQQFNLYHSTNLRSFFLSRQSHTRKGSHKQLDVPLQSFHWKHEAFSNSKTFWTSEIWKWQYWNWPRSLNLILYMMKLRKVKTNLKCWLQSKILQLTTIKRLTLWKKQKRIHKFSKSTPQRAGVIWRWRGQKQNLELAFSLRRNIGSSWKHLYKNMLLTEWW